jgi:uncharacterized protein (TIGR03435 family)
MTLLFAGMTLAALLLQQPPTFKVADVHTSPRITNTLLDRLGPKMDFRTSLRGERYQVRYATMVDLIRTAYGVDSDQVSGGPNWLGFDRFDVTALVPPNTPQATLKLMLQSLLADRFKLAVHTDTRPLPKSVLTLGKGKPKLKEADPAGKAGCQSQIIPPATTPGQTSQLMMGISCRNITMEGFAAELTTIAANDGYVGNALVDVTGMKGSWDFDFKFTNRFVLQIAGSDAVPLFDSIDKQLGLKVEEQKIPARVVIVDRVNEKPSANAPDLDQKLPPAPPAEFEVAVIKPSGAGASRSAGPLGVQTGGRFNSPGAIIPLKSLITIAWNLNPNEDLIGAPKWLNTAAFDIVAKLPASVIAANGAPPPVQDLGPMLQALLIDRFKMKIHYEDRQVSAYALVAAKPKLGKADPSTRTRCKVENGEVNVIQGAAYRTVSCQNMTMTQFADQLQSIGPGPYVHYPVVDATGIEGAWNFSFTFNMLSANPGAAPFTSSAAPAGGAPSDPAGGASLLEALDKQLGLKLEAQKRTYPVFVIDHIEEKPTEN